MKKEETELAVNVMTGIYTYCSRKTNTSLWTRTRKILVDWT